MRLTVFGLVFLIASVLLPPAAFGEHSAEESWFDESTVSAIKCENVFDFKKLCEALGGEFDPQNKNEHCKCRTSEKNVTNIHWSDDPKSCNRLVNLCGSKK